MRELTKAQIVQRSINKKFRGYIWSPFIKAVKDYQLLAPHDRVAVCISGGKDSMLLAMLMQQLQKTSEFPFEVEYLVMNPGYNEANFQRIVQNAQLLNIPITVFETDIFNTVQNIPKSPCYLCARMRRGYLYSNAQKLNCNKIALGHHFSDVVETVLLGMFYGAQFQTMVPKLKSKNFSGMELIRPMYCVHEDSVIAWKNHNELEFIECACRFTENVSNGHDSSKRLEIKRLIRELKKDNPEIETRIFKSTHLVNLHTVLGYKKNGVEHSFLQTYGNLIDDEQ